MDELSKQDATLATTDPGAAILELVSQLFPFDLNEVGITFNNPLVIREKIDRLEKLLMNAKGAQIQIKTTHRFSKGLYIREVFIPKGSLVVGKIHKHECFSIMSMGDKTTLTEEGVQRLKAPFSAVSRPGLKRVGFAHEDSIWTTVHATNETDIKKIENELIAKDYSEVEKTDMDLRVLFTMEGEICPT